MFSKCRYGNRVRMMPEGITCKWCELPFDDHETYNAHVQTHGNPLFGLKYKIGGPKVQVFEQRKPRYRGDRWRKNDS